MKKMYLLFSHKLTKEQITDARETLGVEKFVYLPENLQKMWSNVDPVEVEEKSLNEIWEFVTKDLDKEDYILIQGEWGFTFNSILHFKKKAKVIYSTTKREVKEIVKEDGTVEKRSQFIHVKFKSYSLAS
jgi:hypothetical protein